MPADARYYMLCFSDLELATGALAASDRTRSGSTSSTAGSSRRSNRRGSRSRSIQEALAPGSRRSHESDRYVLHRASGRVLETCDAGQRASTFVDQPGVAPKTHLLATSGRRVCEDAAPDRRLSQAVSVIAFYFKDLCGVDMSPLPPREPCQAARRKAGRRPWEVREPQTARRLSVRAHDLPVTARRSHLISDVAGRSYAPLVEGVR